MKIINVALPTFMINDLEMRADGNLEVVSNAYCVKEIVAGEITEYDDGLDEWLIGVKNEGHNEIYLHDISETPLIYNPMTFEPTRRRIIRYWSRYHEPYNENNV